MVLRHVLALGGNSFGGADAKMQFPTFPLFFIAPQVNEQFSHFVVVLSRVDRGLEDWLPRSSALWRVGPIWITTLLNSTLSSLGSHGGVSISCDAS